MTSRNDNLDIAILGATSHIAKGLIDRFLNNGGHQLHLFARTPDKVRDFIGTVARRGDTGYQVYDGYEDFPAGKFDVLINCIGVGTLNRHKGDYTRYFAVTEEFDNLAIDYCIKYPDTHYISLSSGAVYGRGHTAPVSEDSVNSVAVNNLLPEDYYAIVRLYAEAKHRAYHWLKIIDLRIFSYFSRYIDLTDGYFITDLINSILSRKTFVTDSENIVRDYLHPHDLFTMIIKCIDAGKMNRAFDVNSNNPVLKQDILDYFSAAHGLRYEVVNSSTSVSATGFKSVYCSDNGSSMDIGYTARFSSLEAIKSESEYILNKTI